MKSLRRVLCLAMLLAPLSLYGQSEPALTQSARAIPYKEDTVVADTLWRAGWAVLVLGVIALGVMVVYKRMPGLNLHTTSKRLKIIETVRLAPRSALYLVEMDRKALLVGLHGPELRVLVPPEDRKADKAAPANAETDSA